jgi:hypothetical protein
VVVGQAVRVLTAPRPVPELLRPLSVAFCGSPARVRLAWVVARRAQRRVLDSLRLTLPRPMERWQRQCRRARSCEKGDEARGRSSRPFRMPTAVRAPLLFSA